MLQIRLERIADNVRCQMELGRRMINDALGAGIGDAVIGRVPSRAWCAEVIGPDPKYRFARRFLKPNISYLEANNTGSRGVYAYYNLYEGHVYEISAPVSWKRTDRYFARVDGDQLTRLTEEEVLECLKQRSESMS